jgi:transposase
MKVNNVIGFDVSKETLDVAICKGEQIVKQLKIKNRISEIKKSMKQLEREGYLAKESLCCMEHTGIYNNLLLQHLQLAGYLIWVENAVQIKYSIGMTRGKTDKVDAARIARYGYKNQERAKIWTPKRETLEELAVLLKSRKRLLKVKSQLSSYTEAKRFVSKRIFSLMQKNTGKLLVEVKKSIKLLDKQIEELIRSDEHLFTNYQLIKTVEGVGHVIAATVLVKTNEFKDHQDGRKFACNAGVVPFEHSSGKSIRGKTRISHRADKSLKTLFHLAAISVISQKRSELKDYYERKLQEGKNKMLVINAIRNKIIQRIFAVVQRGTPYQKFNNYDLMNP